MKNTVVTFKEMKQKGEKISMLTGYDYSTAKLLDEGGINGILVGDSLGNVMLGYEDTVSVTMEDMIHHGAAVARGAKNALVVIDMPFMSYQTSVYDAVVNAGRLMKEGRANAVKLEGGEEVADVIKAITKAGIPVMAHIGLTPQHVNEFGGYKVQGKDSATAKKLIRDAKAVEAAGAFAVTLECVPSKLAEKVTKSCPEYAIKKREQYKDIIDDNFVLLEDILFNTHSFLIDCICFRINIPAPGYPAYDVSREIIQKIQHYITVILCLPFNVCIKYNIDSPKKII